MVQHSCFWRGCCFHPLRSLFAIVLLVIFSTVGVLADDQNNAYTRDSVYYNGQQMSPVETSFPQYYRDSADLLQDLAKFEKLYIQYHSCKWTDLLTSSNDGNNDANDVDENDYWYQGVNPAPTAAAAISIYGELPDTRTSKWKIRQSKGCQRRTFLNTYVVDPHYLFLKNDNEDGEDQQYSSCGNNQQNDQPYGLGCTESGAFSYFEYSLNWQNEPVCDANHVLSVVDSLDEWNSALNDEENDCLEVSYATVKSLLTYAVSCSFEDPNCPDPVGVLKRYRNAVHSPYSKTVKIVSGLAWAIAAFLALYVTLVLLDELRIACKPIKRKDNPTRSRTKIIREDGDDDTASSLSEDGSSVGAEGMEDQQRGVMTYMSRLFRRKQSSSQSVHEKSWTSKRSAGTQGPFRKSYVPEKVAVEGVQQSDYWHFNLFSFFNQNQATDDTKTQQNYAIFTSAKLIPPSTIGPRSVGRKVPSVYPNSSDKCMLQSQLAELDENRSSEQASALTTYDWLLSVLGMKPTSSDPAVPPAQPITFRSLEQKRAKTKIAELPRIDEDGESTVSQEVDSFASESLIQPPPYNETSMEVLFGKTKARRQWHLFPKRLSKRVDVVRNDASACRSTSNASAKIIGFTSSPNSSTLETSRALAEAAMMVSKRSTSTISAASQHSSLLPTSDSVRFRSFESADKEYLPPEHTSTSGSSDQTDVSMMDEEQTIELSGLESPASQMICCRTDFDLKLASRSLDVQDSIAVQSQTDACDQSTLGENVEMIAVMGSEVAAVRDTKSIGVTGRNQPSETEFSEECIQTTAESHLIAKNRDKEKSNSSEQLDGGDVAKKSCSHQLTVPTLRGAKQRSYQEAFEMVASPAIMSGVRSISKGSSKQSGQSGTKSTGTRTEKKRVPRFEKRSTRKRPIEDKEEGEQRWETSNAKDDASDHRDVADAGSYDKTKANLGQETYRENLCSKSIGGKNPKAIGIREYLAFRATTE